MSTYDQMEQSNVETFILENFDNISFLFLVFNQFKVNLQNENWNWNKTFQFVRRDQKL